MIINTLSELSKKKEDKTKPKHRNNRCDERTIAGAMAASLAIDCKLDASIGNEILTSPNILKQMVEYISLRNSNDFITVCYVNCILCLLNKYRFGSRSTQSGSFKADRIRFNSFVLTSCICKQGIVHGLIIKLFDIVSQENAQNYGNKVYKRHPFPKSIE